MTNYFLILVQNVRVDLWFHMWNYKIGMAMFHMSQFQDGLKVFLYVKNEDVSALKGTLEENNN